MDARVVFCFPVVVESRERGRAAPSRRLRRGNARARAYLVLRAINHRRFRGHAVAHLAQVRPLMAPREFIFVVNLAIARFTEVGVVVEAVDGGVGVVAQHARHHLGRLRDLAMIQIRPDPESTRRLALAPGDPTRREDFFLGASRERHRRCLLRSAMDRPRKRARLPTPTRPSSSFAPRRVSRLTPRVPKRASPSPAPRAPAHAAPSGVDVVTRIKRVSGLSRAVPNTENLPSHARIAHDRISIKRRHERGIETKSRKVCGSSPKLVRKVLREKTFRLLFSS